MDGHCDRCHRPERECTCPICQGCGEREAECRCDEYGDEAW